MQPSQDQTEDNTAKDLSVKNVQPSTSTELQNSSSTSQEELIVADDLIDDEFYHPSVSEAQAEHNLPRSEAREFVKALQRERELDKAAETYSDDHLINETKGILLSEIKRLTQDNIELQEELEHADATTEMTPEMIRTAMKQNSRLLLEIRKELVSSIPEDTSKTQGGITIDIGNIFQEALGRAREISI